MENQKDIQKDILPVYSAPNDFYEHARKLVSAIYLLTGLFEDQEPLKWSLRSKVLEVMSFTGVLTRSVGPSVMRGDEENIIEDISGIKTLLDIGVMSGLVSPMNHEILTRELSVFQENAVRHFHLMKGNQSLYTESLFVGFDWTKQPQLDKGHFKRTQISYKGQTGTTVAKGSSVLNKKTIKDNSSPSNNERKEKIVKLIREKGSVMIKDISPSFPELSEKTIQRDLLDLVSKGSISKSGERRWTVYSVAK